MYCLLLLLLLQQGHGGHGAIPNSRPSKGVQLYMAYESKIISNYSMINGSQFYDVDTNGDDINDALWCQSTSNDSDIGWWFYPNGTQVLPGTLGDNSAPRPVYSNRSVGQIALARKDGLSKNEGLYICLIPDENGVNQTLVVGAYTDSNYRSNDGPDADSSMKFTLISTRDSDPPVFALTFNVTDGPPTDVTCMIDLNSINCDLFRSVLNGPGSVTQVTVTLKTRQAGTYQCTVSNARVDAGTIDSVTAMNSTSTLFIQVTNASKNLSATRLNTGLTHVKLSWSSISEDNGFEIFYHLYDTQTIKSAGTTTNDQFNITSGLFFNQTYKFFIVAYGNGDIVTLPSERSNTTMLSLTNPSVYNFTAIPTNFGIELLWIPPSFSPPIYEVSYQCHTQCEGTTLPLSNITSNPHYNLTNINPGSYCNITIYGLYGNDSVNLTSKNMNTPSIAPTSSVSNVTLSSIEARSMRVSWHDVPCSGQNGLITGYLLQYKNSTFSETVNITGEENREFILTQLTPYTNYTITITAYNDGGTGPASNEVMQQTIESEPGVVTGLMPNYTSISTIAITWREPTEPNGIITTYEIYYKTSNGLPKYIDTNKTQYIIEDLLPHANYTIGVRAYTLTSPGEWSNISTTTSNIPTVSYFFVAKLNDTAVQVIWQPINISGTNHSYIIYYSNQNGTCWTSFSATTSNIVINGLDSVLKYKFRIAMTILLYGMEYEGERVDATLIGQMSQPEIISVCSEQVPQTTISQTSSALSIDDILIFALAGTLGISLIIIAVLILVICVLVKKKKSNNNISHRFPAEEFNLKLPEDTSNKQEVYYVSIPDIKPKIENERFYDIIDEQEYTTMQ